MSDLSYTVEIRGADDLDRLAGTVGKLTQALNGTKGAGRNLAELRNALDSLKGAESSLDQIRQAVSTLDNTLRSEFATLRSVVQTEMTKVAATIGTAGLAAGKAFEDNIEKGMKGATAQIKEEGEKAAATAAAASKSIAVAMNNAQGAYTRYSASSGLAGGMSLGDRLMQDVVKLEKAADKQIKVNSQFAQAELDAVKARRTAREKLVAEGRKQQLDEALLREKAIAEQMRYEQTQAQLRAKEVADRRTAREKLVAEGRKQQLDEALLREKAIAEQMRYEQTQAQLRAKEVADRRTAREKLVAEGRKQQLDEALLREKAIAEQMRYEQTQAQLRKSSMYASAARQVAAATNAPAGAYQVYNPTTGVAGGLRNVVKEQAEAANGAEKLGQALQALTVHGNDTHSMARGLASGFNLLWLTWGNLAPLFAGAVISNGFMQTAKQGAEVAHTLAVIEHVGGNTSAEMERLTKHMIELGKSGPFAPKEIADAMQVLSLAGLKANEILAVTKDVLNFSVAGTTDLKTAADTLVSVSTAFGMGAAGFGRVGDVISKAAAESKTSVESFGNAMKTASVINAQYGVSLEDTATALATMSQLGIEGTAAGTALRNMYADLSGRSGQVAKVLRQQGIEMRDANGQFRPMIEVVAQLNDKFNELDGISQKNLMQALLSERGAKGLIEMLRLIRTEADDTGKGFSNALQEVRQSIEDSAGFAAINAAKLAQTVDSQYRAVGATLKTTMFEAYQAIEPVLYIIAQELQESLASPEFREALTDMVRLAAFAGKGLADFGQVLVENHRAVLLAAGAYATLRVGLGALPALMALKTSATTADTAATAANTAATAANNAAKAGSLGLLTTLGRFLPGIGTAVTVAGLAWAAYSMYMGEATSKGKSFEESHSENVIKSLEAEAARLEKINKLRSTGITLAQAQAQVEANTALDKAKLPLQQAYDAARKDELAAWAEYEQRKNSGRTLFQKRDGFGYEDLGAFKSRAEAASKVASEAWNKQTKVIQDYSAASNKVVEGNKTINAWMQAEQEAKSESLKKMFGTGTFELGAGSGGGGRGPFERAQLDQDNELRSLQAMADQRISVLTDGFNREKRLMDQRRSGELISEAEYMRQSMEMTTNYESTVLANLQTASEEYMAVYSRRLDNLQKLMASAKKPETKSVYAQQIEREMNDMFAQMSKWATDGEKIRAAAAERLEVTYIKLVSETGKLIAADKDFWEGRAQDNRRQREARELAQRYSVINDSIFSSSSALKAQAEAEQKVKFEVEKHNSELEKQLKLKLQTIDLLKAEIAAEEASGGTASDKSKQMLAELEGVAAQIRKTLADSTAEGLAEGARAGFEAFQAERIRQGLALRNELADAIVQGITGDAKSAGKQLRAILQRELLTKPLTAVVQAVVGSVMGAAGMLSQQGAVAGVGNALGMVSNLSSIYSAFSGGLVSSISGAIGTLGSTFGSSALTSFSAGMKGASLASGLAGPTTAGASGAMGAGASFAKALPVVGWIMAGMGASANAYAQGYTEKDLNWANPIGLIEKSATRILTAVGVSDKLAHILTGASLTAKIFDKLGLGKATLHAGAGAIYQNGAVTEGSNIYNRATFGMGSPGEWQKATQTAVSGIATSIGESLDGVAKTFGLKAGYSIYTAFADDSSKDGAWGSLRITDALGKVLVNWEDTRSSKWAPREFGNGQEGYEQYIAAVQADMLTAIQAMDLPGWAKEIFAAAEGADGLTSALSQAAAVMSQFNALAASMSMFKDISGELQTQLLAAAGSMDALASVAGSFYEGFYSEHERMLSARKQQMDALASMGLYIDPAEGEKAKTLFRQTVEEAMRSGQGEMAVKLMAMSASFAQVADYATEMFDGMASKAAQVAKTVESQMTSAFNAMTSAGDLLDKIDGALGGSGNGYSLLREQRLWASMAEADYKQQIELAGQLTDMVLGRYQIEQQNAQKLLDFGKSLRSYVDSLKIGGLSPLTTAEKLSEAAKQYAETLRKAQGGDETAMGSLQGISTSYLDLARQYFASSGDYTRIFNSVTESLDALGLSSQTEAQMQLDVSSQSLSQLRQLQGIVQGAYQKADTDFGVQKALMQQQIDQMLRTANGIEAVRDLLAGMPAELSTQLNGGGSAGTGNYAALAQSYVDLLGGRGSTDVGYVSAAMSHLDYANWQSELNNAMALLTDSASRQQMQSIFDSLAKLNGLGVNGSHANGLDYVPFDGYIAQLHKGERVMTASENRAYTPTWSSYGTGNGVEALVSEVKALRAEVARLRTENREDAQGVARATVASNQDNAERVVQGVGQVTKRAAYATTIQREYK